ncbi:tetratricopeptide repeat protein [Crocosphaera sp.]|uniref:tetratricopeptide repeat protein n=1 Tax=Crocosphaera sp. TaxID=2729996 RepID=UPI003F5929B2
MSNSTGIHIVLEVKGNVTIQKKQWKKPTIPSIGLTLTSDDKIKVEGDSFLKIYCSNTEIWEVKSGQYTVSDGCDSGQPVIPIPNSNNSDVRSPRLTEETLINLPYLISPRETYIITERPLLRWNAVPGVTNYTVKIDGVNWQTQTNKTEIIYPGQPPLQEGWRYRITIETNNGISSTSEAKVGFKRLDSQSQKKVLETVELIQQQSLSSEEKGLILAKLYRGYGLHLDAVNVLEELIKKENQSVFLYQLIGDTYLDMKLPQLSLQPYKNGLILATETDNLTVKSAIQKGLGTAYYCLGNDHKAEQWLNQAKTNYEKLGDTPSVQELDKIIQENYHSRKDC